MNIDQHIIKNDYYVSSFPNLQFEGGLRIVANLLRIVQNFEVFANDHLLDQRTKVFGDENDYTAEHLIPFNMTTPKIFKVLLQYGEHGLACLKTLSSRKTVDFFLCTYFPTVFKAYSGLTCLLQNFDSGSSSMTNNIE